MKALERYAPSHANNNCGDIREELSGHGGQKTIVESREAAKGCVGRSKMQIQERPTPSIRH